MRSTKRKRQKLVGISGYELAGIGSEGSAVELVLPSQCFIFALMG